MNSKGKHQCNVCSRFYVNLSNSLRHVKAKHRKCYNLKLIFNNRICSETMDKSKLLSQGKNTEGTGGDTVGNPINPITSRLRQSYDGHWASFRPLEEGSEKGSTESTCLYSDLEEFVRKDPGTF